MKFKMGGSGIHIKPENKGKFTATKKATGKSTEELTHSKNPVTKKRAIFAQNAAKWKHEDGAKSMKVDEKMCGSKGMKYQQGSQKLKISEKNKKDFLKIAQKNEPNYTLLEPKGFKKPSAKDSSDYKQGYINSKEDSWGKNKSQAYKSGQIENKTRTRLNAKSSNIDKKLYDLKNKIDQTVNNLFSYAEGTKSIKFKKKPMIKRADGSTSQQGLYDNIRKNKGSGKKPTPEMLKQEKKIKAGK
jgi:hypothetical protein